MPATARPSDAPMMPASASGVSTTRALPKRSTSPLVVRKTPPSLPTSSPSTMTRGSRSISSVRPLLIASTMLRCGISVPVPTKQLGALLKDTLGRALVNVVEEVLWRRVRGSHGRLEGGFDLVADFLGHFGLAALIPQAQAAEVLLYPFDRIAQARFLVLVRILIARWVVGGVVKPHPVGHRFDERRAVSRSGPLNGGDRNVVDGHHVVAVDFDALEAVSSRAKREARCR